jgi:hypothetical protein
MVFFCPKPQKIDVADLSRSSPTPSTHSSHPTDASQEAIDAAVLILELSVLFYIPSATSSLSPFNGSSPSTSPWPYLAGDLTPPR